MDKDPITRKGYREYQQNQQKSEPLNQDTSFRRMQDGRYVDENGEIHTRMDSLAQEPQGESERQTAQRFAKNKRYEMDEFGRLTSLGKQQRLKFRLNIAIGVLVILIIATFLILRFVD
ncbi:hypothetical protein KAR50_06210 [Periweissella fabaria]|uniref:Uncharacterized protein n=1 Tax=Periweissella fabaria TaxID=546157 RepID=A0ABM8Z5L5_9LACO|nr:hypothetical protein [Periweissella fabaria]MCM0597435.1 hypothetical protein [Periweissella fabaria]CAH0416060.1 hypothetical protein WFA24289_00359 [Periweissella fabaria]